MNDDTGDDAPSDCEPCASGFYCPYLGATTTTIDYSSNTHKCDEGYICLSGSIKPYGTDGTIARACSAGKYCPRGATSETDCPLGTYNPSTAAGSCTVCPKGKACLSTGLSAPVDCPQGYYCPIGVSGSENRVQCPAGTFSNDTNLSESSECAPCIAGKYCPAGTTDPTVTALNCDAGYFCVYGADSATPSGSYTLGSLISGPCPEGYYCLAGTESPEPCPIGTYGNATGYTQQSDCISCPAGFYCDELGLDSTGITNKQCSAGFVCLSGSTTPTPQDGANGTICDAGKYCTQGTTAMMD